MIPGKEVIPADSTESTEQPDSGSMEQPDIGSTENTEQTTPTPKKKGTKFKDSSGSQSR